MFPRRVTLEKIFVLFLASCLVAGCEDPASITGQVVDNFGVPVEGVSVSAEDTWFPAQTGPGGEFAIEHAAGEIALNFSRQGYADANIPLTATEGSRHALDPVSMIVLPPEGGPYLQGPSTYIPLAQATVSASHGGLIFFTNVEFEITFDSDEAAQLDLIREELSMLSSDAIHVFDTAGMERLPLEANFGTNSLGSVSRLSVILQVDMQSTLHFAEENVTALPVGTRRSIAVAPQSLSPDTGYCFIEPGDDLLLVEAPPIGESTAYCF
jgi:hypothetical protein